MAKIGDYISPRKKLMEGVKSQAGLDFYTREQLEEELIHLRCIVQEGWAWLGVAAPRTTDSVKSYRKLIKDYSLVVRQNKTKEEDSEPDYWTHNTIGNKGAWKDE